MRQIKYRVWDRKEKHMREVAMLRWEDGRMSRIAGYWPDTRNNGWTDHDPAEGIYELMEFTGLIDAKGNDIWEGDILQYINDKGEAGAIKGYVIFSNAAFKIKRTTENKTWQEERFVPSYIKRHQVIGNIHQHSELLK